MHIHTRNVNTAFQTFVSMFHTGEYQSEDGAAGRLAGMKLPITKCQSRNGPVLMLDEPVMVTYERPRERVLFNSARDCNPFFHLYEALWMLAGRNDVASLAYYTSKMAQFSDDGSTFNGAYGYRWRHADFTETYEHGGHGGVGYNWKPVDQLDILVNHLKADPNSRRAVLSMWNVEDDLLKIDGCRCNPPCSSRIDYSCDKQSSKDVCCNLNVMFSVREEARYDSQEVIIPEQYGVNQYLDMTVTNRSNDMILGMLGANFVHFTILQEYMAARLGVEVGQYTQMTNNLHVYDWNWKPEEWLDFERDYPHPYEDNTIYSYDDIGKSTNNRIPFNHFPLVKDPAVFDKELSRFVEQHKELGDMGEWKEPFFHEVAGPMLVAFHWHKKRCYEFALEVLEKCQADDWRIAATNWITKRMEKHDRK